MDCHSVGFQPRAYRGFTIHFDETRDEYCITHPNMPKGRWGSKVLCHAYIEIDAVVSAQVHHADRIHVGLVNGWTFPSTPSLYIMDDFGNGLHVDPASTLMEQWSQQLAEAMAECLGERLDLKGE